MRPLRDRPASCVGEFSRSAVEIGNRDVGEAVAHVGDDDRIGEAVQYMGSRRVGRPAVMLEIGLKSFSSSS